MADALQNLAIGLHRDLGRIFAWDAGLSMALTTFEDCDTELLMTTVEKHLNTSWNSETVRAAPDEIHKLTSDMGGLRPGQWLMHSSIDDGPFLLAVFWPWGGGSPVSMRVKVVGGDAAAEAQLRSWFSVAR